MSDELKAIAMLREIVEQLRTENELLKQQLGELKCER